MNNETSIGYNSIEYWQEKCASLMDDISERNNKIKVRDDIIEVLRQQINHLTERLDDSIAKSCARQMQGREKGRVAVSINIDPAHVKGKESFLDYLKEGHEREIERCRKDVENES